MQSKMKNYSKMHTKCVCKYSKKKQMQLMNYNNKLIYKRKKWPSFQKYSFKINIFLLLVFL